MLRLQRDRGLQMPRRHLHRLPPDLEALGWRLVFAREMYPTPAKVWFTAVYARPFEPGIDDDDLAMHRDGSWWVRISTDASRSASWDDALQDAIALMRHADAQRSPVSSPKRGRPGC
jgi:hypothetical protein